MTVLMYAVTEGAVEEIPDLGTGLDQRPLRTVTHGRLAAVLSDHDTAPGFDQANLWAYEDVVEGLMRARAVLPARFGATVASDEEIVTMLASREDELQLSLSRVRGAVEYAIHAPATPEHEAGEEDAGSGTAYLRRRLAEEQLGRRLAELVENLAGELVRELDPRPQGRLAALVPDEHHEQFVVRMREAELLITGPWPPYSFVEASA